MKEWTIERYLPAAADEWNSFVASARNATFLFDRAYMDYHADRFADCSMLARKGGKLMAVLPANITADGVLHSHQGLTYGGWLLSRRHADCVSVLEFWELWLQTCRDMGITAIDYKPLPHIYAMQPSDEDLYALFRSGAVVTECNCSAAIRLANNPGLNENRRRLLKKAADCRFEIVEIDSDGLADFHSLLSDCLAERHNAKPVHTLGELQLLHGRFPANIRPFGASVDGHVEAAVLVYVTRRVVHAQYIASSATGRDLNLLSALMCRLVDMAAEGRFGSEVEYFDFGTSNEEHGLVLNESLYRQKASFGATAVAYQRFSIKL